MDWKNRFYQDNISCEEKLKHLVVDLKDKSVIDLGCNIGKMHKYCLDRDAKSYLGYDYNQLLINEAIGRNGNSYKNTRNVFKCVDLLKIESLKADVVFALGIFHHFNYNDLIRLLSEINCKTLIIEVPVKGKSNDYFVRSEKDYCNMLMFGYELKESFQSGFKTPPIERRILLFKNKLLEK